MVTATMPKPNPPPPVPPGEDAEKKKESTLKVDQEVAQLVGVIAAHRKVSVKELFRMEDVDDFFKHLLLEEMRKQTERMKKR